jgi:hypothetical protein
MIVVAAPAQSGAVSPIGIPDTVAGAAFASWLEAFNSGDRGRLEAVFKRFVEPRPSPRLSW